MVHILFLNKVQYIELNNRSLRRFHRSDLFNEMERRWMFLWLNLWLNKKELSVNLQGT